MEQDNNNDDDIIKLAKDVLLKYNIKYPENLTIIQNEKEKKVWKFSHNNETMCLKTLRQSKGKVIFTVNAQIFIFNKGGNVPKVYLNSISNPVTEYKDKLFVLYEWIDGRDLNFEKPLDLYLGLEGIAKFHQISKGYVPPSEAKVSYKLGRWTKHYRDKINRMIKWKELALNSVSNPSYSTYINYIDSILELANKALEKLMNSSYDILTNIEYEESSLCHQDYGTANAILSDKGVYVIDLDDVTYDLPIRDLRKIISERMEINQEWDKNIINTILKWYEKTYKLSPLEKELLRIDLLFPYYFFRAAHFMFKKNIHVSPEELSKRAELELSKIAVIKSLK